MAAGNYSSERQARQWAGRRSRLPACGGEVRIRRRREITWETARVTVIRGAGDAAQAWCRGCHRQAIMVPLAEAMMLTGATSREIHRRVEAREVHFIETAEGFVLVCRASLLLSA